MSGKQLVPPYLYSGPSDELRARLRLGEEWSGEFEIWSVERLTDTAWLKGYTADVDNLIIDSLRVESTTVLSDDIVRRKYVVKLTAIPLTDGEEFLRTKLIAQTESNATRPSPLILVDMNWESSLRISPETIYLSRSEMDSNNEIKRRMSLIDSKDIEWRILDITNSADWIRSHVAKDESTINAVNHDVEVIIRPSEALEFGYSNGHVTIQTTHPDQKTLRINVICDLTEP